MEVRKNPDHEGQVAIAVEGVAYGDWFIYDNSSRGFYSDGVRENVSTWPVGTFETADTPVEPAPDVA